MSDIFSIAEDSFNVTGKVVDSGYSSVKFPGNNYVTELRSSRKASFNNIGRMTVKNSDLFTPWMRLLNLLSSCMKGILIP